MSEVARRWPDAAEDAHDHRDLQRPVEQVHVEQRVEVGDVAGVEALVLGPDPEPVHRLDELDDRGEAVLEHPVEDELASSRRVLGVVHRAHVEGGNVGTHRFEVRDTLLDLDADRAGRVVDDDVVDRVEDRLCDSAEVLDLERRLAVGRARVDVDH